MRADIPLSQGFAIKRIAIPILRIWALFVLPLYLILTRVRRRKMEKEFGKIRKSRTTNSSFNKGVLVLSPIDWNFRYQRPQQLARQFSLNGYKTLFLNPTLHSSKGKEAEITLERYEEVLIGTIFLPGTSKYLGIHALSDLEAKILAPLVEEMLFNCEFGTSTILLQQPGWLNLAKRLANNRIVFDCMDDHTGFQNVPREFLDLEKACLELCDVLVTTSSVLAENMKVGLNQRSVTVRNGVQFGDFSSIQVKPSPPISKIGYFGAIAEWFDASLVEQVAVAFPDLKIELIGEVSDPKVLEKLRRYPNVTFLGEIAYPQLPTYISDWGVALIPFLVNKLTLATNPVKMYEYSAAGIPTVATALPEIVSAANDLEGIFISNDSEKFVENISKAQQCSLETLENLKSWAKTQEWSSRFESLELVIQDDTKVTVVVLMWNNADLTIRCLASLVNRGDYGNLEIIVVDNNSEPLESTKVQNWCESNSGQHFVFIRNDANYGFAKGMNIGIKRATGEYVVLLNNDTVVTPGWIHRSLRHFRLNPQLGLLGPSTDNSGNDAYVKIKFMMENWEAESFPRFAFRESSLLERNNLAFFCTFIPRSVIERVGLLDESFGRGYFEDDDYCKRVLIAGYSIGIARDVFVHHEMDASFSKIGNQEKIDLFNENRLRFESKWGKWTPHTYSMDKDQW